jgi:hypothetical protein
MKPGLMCMIAWLGFGGLEATCLARDVEIEVEDVTQTGGKEILGSLSSQTQEWDSRPFLWVNSQFVRAPQTEDAPWIHVQRLGVGLKRFHVSITSQTDTSPRRFFRGLAKELASESVPFSGWGMHRISRKTFEQWSKTPNLLQAMNTGLPRTRAWVKTSEAVCESEDGDPKTVLLGFVLHPSGEKFNETQDFQLSILEWKEVCGQFEWVDGSGLGDKLPADFNQVWRGSGFTLQSIQRGLRQFLEFGWQVLAWRSFKLHSGTDWVNELRGLRGLSPPVPQGWPAQIAELGNLGQPSSALEAAGHVIQELLPAVKALKAGGRVWASQDAARSNCVLGRREVSEASGSEAESVPVRFDFAKTPPLLWVARGMLAAPDLWVRSQWLRHLPSDLRSVAGTPRYAIEWVCDVEEMRRGVYGLHVHDRTPDPRVFLQLNFEGSSQVFLGRLELDPEKAAEALAPKPPSVSLTPPVDPTASETSVLEWVSRLRILPKAIDRVQGTGWTPIQILEYPSHEGQNGYLWTTQGGTSFPGRGDQVHLITAQGQHLQIPVPEVPNQKAACDFGSQVQTPGILKVGGESGAQLIPLLCKSDPTGSPFVPFVLLERNQGTFVGCKAEGGESSPYVYLVGVLDLSLPQKPQYSYQLRCQAPTRSRHSDVFSEGIRSLTAEKQQLFIGTQRGSAYRLTLGVPQLTKQEEKLELQSDKFQWKVGSVNRLFSRYGAHSRLVDLDNPLQQREPQRVPTLETDRVFRFLMNQTQGMPPFLGSLSSLKPVPELNSDLVVAVENPCALCTTHSRSMIHRWFWSEPTWQNQSAALQFLPFGADESRLEWVDSDAAKTAQEWRLRIRPSATDQPTLKEISLKDRCEAWISKSSDADPSAQDPRSLDWLCTFLAQAYPDQPGVLLAPVSTETFSKQIRSLFLSNKHLEPLDPLRPLIKSGGQAAPWEGNCLKLAMAWKMNPDLWTLGDWVMWVDALSPDQKKCLEPLISQEEMENYQRVIRWVEMNREFATKNPVTPREIALPQSGSGEPLHRVWSLLDAVAQSTASLKGLSGMIQAEDPDGSAFTAGFFFGPGDITPEIEPKVPNAPWLKSKRYQLQYRGNGFSPESFWAWKGESAWGLLSKSLWIQEYGVSHPETQDFDRWGDEMLIRYTGPDLHRWVPESRSTYHDRLRPMFHQREGDLIKKFLFPTEMEQSDEALASYSEGLMLLKYGFYALRGLRDLLRDWASGRACAGQSLPLDLDQVNALFSNLPDTAEFEQEPYGYFDQIQKINSEIRWAFGPEDFEQKPTLFHMLEGRFRRFALSEKASYYRLPSAGFRNNASWPSAWEGVFGSYPQMFQFLASYLAKNNLSVPNSRLRHDPSWTPLAQLFLQPSWALDLAVRVEDQVVRFAIGDTCVLRVDNPLSVELNRIRASGGELANASGGGFEWKHEGSRVLTSHTGLVGTQRTQAVLIHRLPRDTFSPSKIILSIESRDRERGGARIPKEILTLPPGSQGVNARLFSFQGRLIGTIHWTQGEQGSGGQVPSPRSMIFVQRLPFLEFSKHGLAGHILSVHIESGLRHVCQQVSDSWESPLYPRETDYPLVFLISRNLEGGGGQWETKVSTFRKLESPSTPEIDWEDWQKARLCEGRIYASYSF